VRVGRSSSQVASLKLKSAARLSAEAIRSNNDPGAVAEFLGHFAQELSASTPPTASTASSSTPAFGR
jgi:hypothetical protein